MNNSTLIAILSISCPVLTLIIPSINSLIANHYLVKLENNKFFNRIKCDTLNSFINSINAYLTEPNEMNKEKCFSAIAKLYCYFKVPKNFNYENIFVGKTIDFEEVNNLIQTITDQQKYKKQKLTTNK